MRNLLIFVTVCASFPDQGWRRRENIVKKKIAAPHTDPCFAERQESSYAAQNVAGVHNNDRHATNGSHAGMRTIDAVRTAVLPFHERPEPPERRVPIP